MDKLKVGILTLIFFFAIAGYSQVTIGSSEPSLPGALLDLKMGGDGMSTKGLLLPRVELTDLTSLNDIGVTTGDGLVQVGMILYHVTSNDCNVINPGIYMWEGAKWIPLTGITRSIITSQIGLQQPNSYIVNGVTTNIVKIPIQKAFSVWDGYSWTDDNGNPLLPSKTLENLTVDILWTDNPDMICELSLNIETDIQSSIIEVHTRRNSYGNASIALKSNSEIVWSWHIWATETITEKSSGGYVWMDKNLGAQNNKVGDTKAIGLLYQWGRKDPFSNINSWDTTTSNVVTEILDVSNYDVVFQSIKESIENPNAFMINTAPPYFDWYNNRYWNGRWGYKGDKSVSDPCPEGWRVPSNINNLSPWNSAILGSVSAYVIDFGWNWDNYGFYPSSGTKSGLTGSLSGSNSGGYYWTASTNPAGFPLAMFFNDNTLYSNGISYGAEGMSVRCVRAN